ncbi:MAG: metal ABC transporter substrate-binding protein [Holophagales bacterium]|nr:metal ABC transporter substrate-binding protein [Holophagales bacterium]
MIHKLIGSLAILLPMLVAGCGGEPAGHPSPDGAVETASADQDAGSREAVESLPRPTVAATCAPMAWLVRRLAGERVELLEVLPPEADPRTWTAPAEVLVALQGADLIVAQGAGYEAFLTTASLPRSRMVASTEGMDLLQLRSRTHSHGPGGEHSHAGDDPHTWISPRRMAEQASRVTDALVRLHPEHEAEIRQRSGALDRELDELDAALAEALAPAAGAAGGSWALATNHPSYAYLAADHELELRSFDLDPASPPPGEVLDALADWATRSSAEGRAPVLFWESEPDTGVRQGIEEAIRGARQAVLLPLERPIAIEGEPRYDYFEQARINLETLGALFTAGASAR